MPNAPDEMTDEQLIEPREIVSCMEAEDGGWDVVLSCGHQALFVVQPTMKKLIGCAQCLDIYIQRSQHATTDR